jgi:hypothetical protein
MIVESDDKHHNPNLKYQQDSIIKRNIT